MTATGTIKPAAAAGRIVTAETLTAAPSVLGLRLADPWRRFSGMMVDLCAVGVLSLLSGPWLGLATGFMLIVLFGNAASAPIPLKAVRLGCRVLGAIIVVLSVFALGHVSLAERNCGAPGMRIHG